MKENVNCKWKIFFYANFLFFSVLYFFHVFFRFLLISLSFPFLFFFLFYNFAVYIIIFVFLTRKKKVCLRRNWKKNLCDLQFKKNKWGSVMCTDIFIALIFFFHNEMKIYIAPVCWWHLAKATVVWSNKHFCVKIFPRQLKTQKMQTKLKFLMLRTRSPETNLFFIVVSCSWKDWLKDKYF